MAAAAAGVAVAASVAGGGWCGGCSVLLIFMQEEMAQGCRQERLALAHRLSSRSEASVLISNLAQLQALVPPHRPCSSVIYRCRCRGRARSATNQQMTQTSSNVP